MKLTGKDKNKNGNKVTYDLDLCDIQLENVYDGITMTTKEGNKMSVCMRDGGFEFSLKNENSDHINFFTTEHKDNGSGENNVCWFGDNLNSFYDLSIFNKVEDPVDFEVDGEYLNFVNNREAWMNNDPSFKTLEHVTLTDGKEILVYNCKVPESLPKKVRDEWAGKECEKLAEKLELTDNQHLIFNLILDK